MKVAIVVNRFPTISETFVINHVTALLDAGVEVDVFSLLRPKPNQAEHPQFAARSLQRLVQYGPDVPKGKIKRVLMAIPLMLRSLTSKRCVNMFKLLNVFRFGKEALDLSLFYKGMLFTQANKYDVIHCHFGPVGNLMQKIRAVGLVKGKVVVSFHGYDFLQQDILKQEHYYKELFTRCEGIVANSMFTKQRLTDLGCRDEKIVILPVIPDNDLFSIARRCSLSKHEHTPFRILTVARLVEKKGVQYAIEAIGILKHKYHVPVKYEIIGDGPLMKSLMDRTAEMQLEEDIWFAGAQPQGKIAERLLDADVFLLSSIVDQKGDTETQGLVLIEAQMMGVPVVCTNVGGIPDSVQANVSALIVDAKEPQQIALAISRLYQDKELRNKMGKAARKFAEGRFSSHEITCRTLKYYAALTAEK